MNNGNRNGLIMIGIAIVFGGLTVLPPGRKLISRIKWRTMGARKRYTCLWERTRQSLYSPSEKTKGCQVK